MEFVNKKVREMRIFSIPGRLPHVPSRVKGVVIGGIGETAG